MKYVYEDPAIALPIEYFRQPENVERDTICTESKKIATEFCPTRTVEIFNKKYSPGKCDIHTSWRPKDSGNSKNSINF
jgi:hypothetical protein